MKYYIFEHETCNESNKICVKVEFWGISFNVFWVKPLLREQIQHDNKKVFIELLL